MTEKDKNEEILKILENTIKNESPELNLLRSALSAILKGPEASSSWLNQFYFKEKEVSFVGKDATVEEYKKLVKENDATIFIRASDAPRVIAGLALDRYANMIINSKKE